MVANPNQPLEDIDNPYLKEYILCSLSFVAFVIRHGYIQDRRTKKTIPFHLWPGQSLVAPLFETVKRLIALKARQIGITWLTAAYVLWRAIFHANELIIIISAKEDLASEFLDRVKFMFDHLPGYLKPKVYKRTNSELTFAHEERDAAGNIILQGLQSTIKSLPSTPDAGQSKTISLLVMDESAINRYCKEIWSAATPTLEHSDGQAIVISNPTKTGYGWPWTRAMYSGSMKGANDFHRIFLDPFTVPTRDPATFIENVMRTEGLDEEDRIMQYPLTEEEAISSIGGSYFGGYLKPFKAIKGKVGDLRITRKKRIIFEERAKGVIEIWRWPQKDWFNRYCLGSDVGEGVGASYSVAYVYDRFLQEFIARARSNKIDADKWANILIMLAVYYGKCRIGIERQGPGLTTVVEVQRVYKNLYTRRREGRTRGTYTNEYGWFPSEESKRFVCANLKTHFRDVFAMVPCGVLLDECSTFIDREGREGLGAEKGAFDDCVMGAAITLEVSRTMPEVKTVEEVKEAGWREKLWGDYDRKKLTAYDIAAM